MAAVLAAISFSSGAAVIGQAAVEALPVALIGGTVFPSPAEAPVRDAVVLIVNGRIAAVGQRTSVAVPANASRIDSSGWIVMAGFWNSHVHFQERKWANVANIPATEVRDQLQEMLTRYGFTTVFDTGSMLQNTLRLRGRIESGEVSGPMIRTTGALIYPPGASPPDLALDITGAMRYPLPEVSTAAEGTVAASALLDAGADGIKVYAATWAPPIVAMPAVALRAAVDEARRRGRPAFAHPSNREGLVNAVRGGADVLVHTAPQAGAWDAALLSEMKAAGVAVIPTLKLWRYELRHDRASVAARVVQAALEQLRGWRGVGGAVIFGTDAGYMNDYDPREEYELLAAAGMTVPQILASLTTVPAERFGDSERSARVAAGMAADLTILRRDPSEDVGAFADVEMTIRNGKVIYRRESGGR